MKMNALVVGCGSIGRKHIANLIGLDCIGRVYVYSKVKNIRDIFHSRKVEPVKGLNAPADFAIIANETYKHIDTAISLAKNGLNLFIEKPVSNNLDGINKLKLVARKNNIKIAVGYNLRFLGCIKLIKGLLKKGRLGKLYFARFEAGQYLPDWRKNIDYRECYSSFESKGGGVSLDLSHEIDYMRYFFGEPYDYKTMKARSGSLKIDSEDIFEAVYFFDNNFVCSVHLDYLRRNKERRIFILGSKAQLECDLVSKKLTIKKNNGRDSVLTRSGYFDIEKTYKDELRDFIKAIKSGKKPDVSIEDGIKVLELLER